MFSAYVIYAMTFGKVVLSIRICISSFGKVAIATVKSVFGSGKVVISFGKIATSCVTYETVENLFVTSNGKVVTSENQQKGRCVKFIKGYRIIKIKTLHVPFSLTN